MLSTLTRGGKVWISKRIFALKQRLMTVMNTNTWCLSGGGGMVTSWFTLGGGQRHRTWMNFWRKCRYWAWFDMKTLCSSWGHVLSHLTLLLLQGKYPVLASLSIVYLFESLLSARSKCKREFTLRECSGDIRKPSGVFGNLLIIFDNLRKASDIFRPTSKYFGKRCTLHSYYNLALVLHFSALVLQESCIPLLANQNSVISKCIIDIGVLLIFR